MRQPLPGSWYRPLANAEHVTVGVLEPGTARRTDLGDEVDGLWRLVLLESDPPRGQIMEFGLDVIDLEVRDRWTTDRGLSTPNRELRPLAGAEPTAKRSLLEERQAKLFRVELLGSVDVRHYQRRDSQ